MERPSEHADLLCAFLADADAACPNCRYNLRGLRTSECPECGDSLALALAPRTPKHTVFALAAAAPIAGTAYGACLTAAMFLYGTATRPSADRAQALVLAATTVLYAAPVLGRWHLSRRILRMSLAKVRLACAASWLFSIGLAMIAAWVIRHV